MSHEESNISLTGASGGDDRNENRNLARNVTFNDVDIIDRGDDGAEDARFSEASASYKGSDDGYEAFSEGSHVAPSSGSSRRNERAVSINLSAKNYTKLEVIKAEDISKLLWWIHGVILFALLFCVVLVILANTQFLQFARPEIEMDMDMDMEIDTMQTAVSSSSGIEGLRTRFYYFPRAFDMFVIIGNMLCFVLIVSLSVVYTKRISSLRRKDRTHEQVWVIFLTISASLYMNPFENIVRLLEKIGINAQEQVAYRELALFYDSVKDGAFSASTLFYVWASVHSYRKLDSSKLGKRFYIPKIGAVVLYVFLKIAAYWSSRVYFAEMPFASMIGMIYLFSIMGEWNRASVIWVCFITVYEILLISAIFNDIRVTKKYLRNKDYMKYRTKQIGFRFFLYHNFTFYVLFWLCYIMLLLALPPGSQIALQNLLDIVYVEVQYLPLGLYVFYLSYVTVECFANMPADAIGWKGWLSPQEPRVDGDVEPIMYRKREPKGVGPKANILVMETAAVLFNFSWLAYYYNTDKMKRLKGGMKTNFDYTVAQFISNKDTDTNAIIVDGHDRILVAFQGTKSLKNLMTDLNAFYTRLNRVLPTGLATPEGGNTWGDRAKVHRGFADAYTSVSREVIDSVSFQYKREPRPIYFSGHSLGGALATLCALDCFHNLDIVGEDITVITYGSPRVGNKEFQKAYDDKISAHWRVENVPDIIPSLPKVGYMHVGKKVLITATGDLFIDPNSMEMSLWGKQAQSLLYHRKSSYLLAMKSWCNRHDSGAYKPPFWKWPVAADDTRRFPDADRVNSGTQEKAKNAGRRIIEQDAMIDALDSQDNEAAMDNRALENWKRLTRRLLLQEKLKNSM